MSTFTFTVRRRDLAWATALIVLLSAIWVGRSDVADAGGPPPPVGIGVVYIAVGTGFADSLGVGPGAAAASAPIIILPTNPPIPAESSTELLRLDPFTVIIVGGTGVISLAMENEVKALLPDAHVTRIAGNNRYATNAAFSSLTFPIQGWATISAPAFTGLVPATDAVAIGAGASNSSTGFLYASIQLPHGAQILELKAMGGDTVADNLVVILYRVSTSQQTIATTASSGGSGSVEFSTSTIAQGTEIVDNEHYSYQIYVTGSDGNPVIRNVMVRYQLGASG